MRYREIIIFLQQAQLLTMLLTIYMKKLKKRGERIVKITSVGGNNILYGSAITAKDGVDI